MKVKLADFGSAIIVAKASLFPLVSGTPAFMAPELYKIYQSSDFEYDEHAMSEKVQ